MRVASTLFAIIWLAGTAATQVHYHDDGRPWKQRANKGPDRDVPGWYYNLGITGLRIELLATDPTHLAVRYVFAGSPAHGKLRAGDHIVGAAGQEFSTPHRNGYGMKVFGPQGPIADFAAALQRALARGGNGRLTLKVLRKGKSRDVTLKVDKRHGAYGPTFPSDCRKSERRLRALLDYLVEQQRRDGSWGSPPRNTFAPLALLASGERRYRKSIEKCVRFHARTTKAKDHDSLINWRYMAAGHLSEPNTIWQTRRTSGSLPELEEIRDFLLAQPVHRRPSQTRPEGTRRPIRTAVPKTPGEPRLAAGVTTRASRATDPIGDAHRSGGADPRDDAALWHRRFPERTARLGAYAFLDRVGPATTATSGTRTTPLATTDWADPGRTGAAGVANWLCPYPEADRPSRACRAACAVHRPNTR